LNVTVEWTHPVLTLVREIYGRFAPSSVRPLDVSPSGRFTPKTFRPLDVSPLGRFATWSKLPKMLKIILLTALVWLSELYFFFPTIYLRRFVDSGRNVTVHIY